MLDITSSDCSTSKRVFRLVRRTSGRRRGSRSPILLVIAETTALPTKGRAKTLPKLSLEGTVLQQVRDALQRIEDGIFGCCVVDGEPIEPKRLEAVPWTPYCVKHRKLLEATSRLRTPSL